MTEPAPAPEKRNRRVMIAAAAVPLAMFGAAYAAVPLYELFCQVTGFGGTTRIAEQAASRVLEREVTIRFDANTADGINWAFRAEQPEIRIKVGENALAFYRVTNTSDRPVTAVATYNVTPHKAGQYFMKLECFCFQDKTLQPGETAELPVIFYVDPAIAEDPQRDDVKTITLSYTFFAKGEERMDLAALPQAATP
jgi:cytochrome c oxidase assembly protein subunit 11